MEHKQLNWDSESHWVWLWKIHSCIIEHQFPAFSVFTLVPFISQGKYETGAEIILHKQVSWPQTITITASAPESSSLTAHTT